MAVVVTLLYRDCALEWANMLIVTQHVGTHGSCVRPSNHVCARSILLEWTHEPCVPTCRVTINMFARSSAQSLYNKVTTTAIKRFS